tara:strand:- start:716 stop:982 length:267 start_codon:yes stop_codon:yes gene_type:complete
MSDKNLPVHPDDGKIYIPNSRYIQLYADMAEAILLEHHQGKIKINQIEDNGDERFTEEAQDLFDYYCGIVEEVLSNNDICDDFDRGIF